MIHRAALHPYTKRLMIICQAWLISTERLKSYLVRTSQSGETPLRSLNNVRFIRLCAAQVYYISKGSLKIANKQYTSVKNDYEMSLNGESTIIPCDDAVDVPVIQCDFVSIGDLENREKDSIIGKDPLVPAYTNTWDTVKN